MKKITNQVEYTCKGELVSFIDNTINVEIVKKDDVIEDNVSIDEMIIDLEEFCRVNAGKNIEVKMLVKASE